MADGVMQGPTSNWYLAQDFETGVHANPASTDRGGCRNCMYTCLKTFYTGLDESQTRCVPLVQAGILGSLVSACEAVSLNMSELGSSYQNKREIL